MEKIGKCLLILVLIFGFYSCTEEDEGPSVCQQIEMNRQEALKDAQSSSDVCNINYEYDMQSYRNGCRSSFPGIC